jgi:Thoeris protein ThsB, TIR-like domain
LIGNGTASRGWVDWELRKALEFGKGICGVRLRDSRGRVPELLHKVGAPISTTMAVGDVIKVIECAAARRT